MNREEYALAIAQWGNGVSDYHSIAEWIRTNYTFKLSKDQIDKIKDYNSYEYICAEVGVVEGSLVLIFVPLTEKGVINSAVTEYQYTTLEPQKYDLVLQETKEFKIVKNALLSNDLQKIGSNTDMYFPVSEAPVFEQDKAVEAIERWRDEGMEWFYHECSEFGGARIFRKFYVPMEDLCHPIPEVTRIVCSFGLRYNDIYQRMLVTLIFISYHELLQNGGTTSSISNTYDWAKPCPPVCRIPGFPN
ncbi:MULTISPECIES: hypothetical protein [Chryseobacterium]|uniref:hypothetical protein n=1 Tax=Chryseobacterium TaxID=59732 RepID=UPI001297DB49|nr:MULTISPECIES: hypothetical protein [Chryseobacterium]MDR6923358.1 hypothetical protein [Chryseobacterium sp. 2987]